MATVLLATAVSLLVSHEMRKSISMVYAAEPVAATAQEVQREDQAGGQASQDHYSTLRQINRSNVKKLKVAWTYDTGEAGKGMQMNPIVIGRVLYTYTKFLNVIALDATTGSLIWKFDSGLNARNVIRGLTYWTDGKESRLLAGIDSYLYALDPATGKPIRSFGEDGRIDLRKDLRGDYRQQSVVITSPGVIYKDMIIVGGQNPETPPAPPGDIRAFDVHTGALRWRFRTIPHPGEPGYESWPPDAWKTAGAANNWSGMTVDDKRGFVYVPTGSAVPDFYGGARVGNDLFADTLLALDANTGKMIWYFQGVHHDIWDRDFPSAPVLATIQHDGRKVDVVAQTTKQGYLFILDRDTGKAIYPVEERTVAASTVPGEVSSKTQPASVLPLPYARQSITEDDLTDRTPEAHAWALQQFRTFVNGPVFTPLSVGKQTIVIPGFDGGAEWGGPGVDRATGVIYINANDIAWVGGLEVNDLNAGLGRHTYQTQCSMCHHDDRRGAPPDFPSLVDVTQRLSQADISNVIHQGRGRMPSFPDLQDAALKSLLEYLRTGIDTGVPEDNKELSHRSLDDVSGERKNDKPVSAEAELPSEMVRYRFTGYQKFYDPDGYPAVKPPWGTLNAIDMNTGKYLWKVPLGYYPELAAKGMSATGTENYGGPIVTAGGLVFIGASLFDREFRAFDSRTGVLLWEAKLPFSGVATPTTYMVDGKQYIVITAGGGKNSKVPLGGAYVAFSLP